MTPAAMQHASESAVLCEIVLGGYWCPELPPDLFSGTSARQLLAVCRELREKRNLRWNLSAVVAAVRKLGDREVLQRLAELVNPRAPHWWDGERHLQFHLRRLVQLKTAWHKRQHALAVIAATDQGCDVPDEPPFNDPTPILMDRQWNLRPDRPWLTYPTKPRLQLARA